MPQVGFEPAIPASEQAQTDALDCAAAGIGPLYSEQRLSWPAKYLATTERWVLSF
jgi:hypothetical protein